MLSLRNICLLCAGSRFLAQMLPSCSLKLAMLIFNGCFTNVQHDRFFFLFLSPERE